MAGMRKARVLPEPVRAAPRTSLPVRRTGMDFAWTGVIVVRPISESAREVDSERSRLENGGRPDSVGSVESGLEDEFEGPGCSASSGSWAFLLFFPFFLLELVSVGGDIARKKFRVSAVIPR